MTKSLMGTYALWQFIGMLVVSPTTAPAQWWAPVGPMWYLLALFFWRMSVLVLGGLKDVVIFACALFMGLFVGFTETAVSKNDLAVFDLQRVFVYAVYFYIGCCVIKPHHLRKLKQMQYEKRATLGVIVLLGVSVAWYVSLYIVGACFDEAQWSVWSTRPYNSGSISDMFSGMAQRIGLYVFSLVAAVGFSPSYRATSPSSPAWDRERSTVTCCTFISFEDFPNSSTWSGTTRRCLSD